MSIFNDIAAQIKEATSTAAQNTLSNVTDSAAARISELFKGAETAAVADISGAKVTPPATMANVEPAATGATPGPNWLMPVVAVIGVLVVVALFKR